MHKKRSAEEDNDSGRVRAELAEQDCGGGLARAAREAAYAPRGLGGFAACVFTWFESIWERRLAALGVCTSVQQTFTVVDLLVHQLYIENLEQNTSERENLRKLQNGLESEVSGESYRRGC